MRPGCVLQGAALDSGMGWGLAGEKKLWTECHLGPPEVEAREEDDGTVAARGGTPGGRG